MTLALFRIIEPVSGTIEIDGYNISDFSLNHLRRKLTVIAQVCAGIHNKLCSAFAPADCD